MGKEGGTLCGHVPESVSLADTCASTCGLDALIACRMGVMSGWTHAKTPGSKAAHVARYARPPFKTRVQPLSSRKLKKWERCFKGGGRA